jgi:hypothetical protein
MNLAGQMSDMFGQVLACLGFVINEMGGAVLVERGYAHAACVLLSKAMGAKRHAGTRRGES